MIGTKQTVFTLRQARKEALPGEDEGITNPKGGGRFFFVIKKVQDLRFLVERTRRTYKNITPTVL